MAPTAPHVSVEGRRDPRGASSSLPTTPGLGRGRKKERRSAGQARHTLVTAVTAHTVRGCPVRPWQAANVARRRRGRSRREPLAQRGRGNPAVPATVSRSPFGRHWIGSNEFLVRHEARWFSRGHLSTSLPWTLPLDNQPSVRPLSIAASPRLPPCSSAGASENRKSEPALLFREPAENCLATWVLWRPGRIRNLR
jgi:hypothetical protein